MYLGELLLGVMEDNGALLPQKPSMVYVCVCLLACQVLRMSLSLWQTLASSCACIWSPHSVDQHYIM